MDLDTDKKQDNDLMQLQYGILDQFFTLVETPSVR